MFLILPGIAISLIPNESSISLADQDVSSSTSNACQVTTPLVSDLLNIPFSVSASKPSA